MKRRILAVAIMLSVMLWGINIYAADGDLIVNGNVGVGTTTPTTKLDVNGDIKGTNINAGGNVTVSGNVGVGTTAPAAKLDVNGDIRIGTSTSSCTSANEGATRYDGTYKRMEFCNGTAWRPFIMAAMTYASQYPPAHTDTYVKATTVYTGMPPYYATDPTKSLTGGNSGNSWHAALGNVTNQRFHIDLGSAKVIKRIYYENGHNSGSNTNHGAQNFTFWGSNDANAFSTLTYGSDTGWTQLTTSQSSFEQHITGNVADPRYILLTNTNAYQYYAFKFANNYGDTTWGIAVRRIELQTETGYEQQ